MSAALVLVLIAVGAIVWLIGSSFMIVRQKRVRVIEGFGKFKNAKYAGIAVKKPYPFHYVAGEMSLKVQSLEEKVSIKTKDNVFLTLPVIVQYTVSDPEKAFYELENPEEQMRSLILNNVKSEANQMQMEEIYSDKTKLQQAIIEELGSTMESYGYTIRNLLVDEPELSEDLVRSFNDVKAAERDRDAAERRAQGQRKQEVAAAEGRKEAAIADAEAIKTREAAKGEAVSQHRQALAQGYAKAGETLRASFPNADDAEIIQLLTVLDRNQMLQNAAEGQANTIMLPQGADAKDASPPLVAARAADAARTSGDGTGGPWEGTDRS